MTLSRNILCHGKDEPIVTPIRLRAGDLQMIFDPENAFLRYVRLGDHEVVRSVYGAVRDQHWNTVSARIWNLELESADQAFQIRFEVECKAPEIDFFWKGAIAGYASGAINFDFDGEARSTFLRNRIGLCVLHPILECAGKPCLVEQLDGRLAQGHFPDHISPYQPFKNIRSLNYEIAPGARAVIEFEGDVFEMEDQRNYGDASFKTYSTPQELPRPVQVDASTRIRQSVRIWLQGERRKILPVLQGRAPQFSIATSTVFPKPPIGLGIASHGEPLTTREIERLRPLELAHLRADLHLSDPSFRGVLREAAHQAHQLGTSLQAALFLTERAEEELSQLLLELQEVRPNVSLWMVFQIGEGSTSEKWIRVAHQKLSPLSPNILIAGGSRTHFVELNRHRPPADSSALPCYPINPQNHATDNLTVVENLAAQRMTVESLQQFCPRLAVISPITLREQSKQPSRTDLTRAMVELPPDVDPRQASLLGAGWTLGSIAELSSTGRIHSLTYYETTGWGGIMETESGSPLPALFPSRAAIVFPIYHVLADLAGFDRVHPTLSSHPLQTLGLALLNAQNQRRILVANLTGEQQEVKIKTGSCRARIYYLDETNAEEAMASPEAYRSRPGKLKESVAGKIELNLLPFAYARIDST